MNRNEKKIALNKQINDFTEDLKEKAGGFKNIGKDAIVIGGILLVGYSLMRIFDFSEDEQEANQVETESILSSSIKGAATSVLLALAKVKLTEYLENLNSEDA